MDHYYGGDSDMSSFTSGLDGAVDNITAEDNQLIAEYGHPAAPEYTAPHYTGPDYLTHPTAADPTDQWADHLNGTVNSMQEQTDAVIAYAEHSPGFGTGINPQAAAALRAYGVADGIRASSYQDFENGLTLSDGESALADGSAADATSDD